MIPDIPKLQRPQIERVVDFSSGIKDHPYQELNKKQEEQHLELLNQVKSAAIALQASNPLIWERYELGMMMLFSSAKALANRSPMHFVALGLEADYYALNKAYSDGQVAILDSIFAVLETKKNIEYPDLDRLKQRSNDGKSFIGKLVDKIKRIWYK